MRDPHTRPHTRADAPRSAFLPFFTPHCPNRLFQTASGSMEEAVEWASKAGASVDANALLATLHLERK